MQFPGPRGFKSSYGAEGSYLEDVEDSTGRQVDGRQTRSSRATGQVFYETFDGREGSYC